RSRRSSHSPTCMAGTCSRSGSMKAPGASMSELVVKLPTPCDRCRSLTGKIVGSMIVCAECSAHRMPVSQKTSSMLERVSRMFGAPAEIVFRTSDARDKIEQQDLILSNKYAKDGRSWHQVITDTMTGADDGAPIDGDAIEAVTKPALPKGSPMPKAT